MTTGIVVQARMSSSRCPGKVLAPLAETPLLQYVCERLERSKAERLVVATSTRSEDDAVEGFCRDRGIESFRGSLDDVAGRLVQAAQQAEIDILVRICADSPLIDPAIVDRALDAFVTDDADLVTNVFPRTFPVGQSVEVVRTETLADVHRRITNPSNLEHPTTYFYDNHEGFKIRNIAHRPSLSDRRMAVDYPEDLERMEAVLRRLDRPHWTYRMPELIELADW